MILSRLEPRSRSRLRASGRKSLEIDEVGVLDSFFDLGGDSLRAARFVTRFREQNGKEMDCGQSF